MAGVHLITGLFVFPTLRLDRFITKAKWVSLLKPLVQQAIVKWVNLLMHWSGSRVTPPLAFTLSDCANPTRSADHHQPFTPDLNPLGFYTTHAQIPLRLEWKLIIRLLMILLLIYLYLIEKWNAPNTVLFIVCSNHCDLLVFLYFLFYDEIGWCMLQNRKKQTVVCSHFSAFPIQC